EVRLTVGDRVWVRAPSGKTFEAPPAGTRDATQLLVPLRRTGADLLAEWKVLGVRDDVTYVTRSGDRTVTVIGARPGERSVPQVWLDPERGVVRFVTREKLPTGWGVEADGTYGSARWHRRFWRRDDRHHFIVRVNRRPAGFALVRELPAVDGVPSREMAEFFVLRTYRRSGVGTRVARALFRSFPG